MNILVGAHGTGKSTLLEELNSISRNSITRVYTSDGFSRPVKSIKETLKLTSNQEQILLNELTLWRWNQDLKKPNCLFTRSLLDAIVYSQILEPELDISNLVTVFESTFKYIENVFYIPIEFPLTKDGVRFEDKGLQKRIDENFLIWLRNYQIPFVTVKGSVDQRVQILLKHL